MQLAPDDQFRPAQGDFLVDHGRIEDDVSRLHHHRLWACTLVLESRVDTDEFRVVAAFKRLFCRHHQGRRRPPGANAPKDAEFQDRRVVSNGGKAHNVQTITRLDHRVLGRTYVEALRSMLDEHGSARNPQRNHALNPDAVTAGHSRGKLEQAGNGSQGYAERVWRGRLFHLHVAKIWNE